jgi:peptidyl-prolyl cis-trans isomerase A (cyclophilin A)
LPAEPPPEPTVAAPEPAPPPPPRVFPSTEGIIPAIPISTKQVAAKPVAKVKASDDDPPHGVFSLAQATRGLGNAGVLLADIETSEGNLVCRLLESQAPRNVATFVGLARGIRPFKDPATGKWVSRPVYDGTTFHRIIRGFMIQGGDPLGTGRSEPGFVVPDEIWQNGAHDRAGLLCAANRGPNTNGLQFFLTDAPAPHLDGGYTIFGACEPVDVVHAIAAAPVVSERPLDPVEIRKVTIRRSK